MIPRQPIPHIRRQQEPLFTTTINEILAHAGIQLNAPDGTPFVRQPHPKGEASMRSCLWRRTGHGPGLGHRPCPHIGAGAACAALWVAVFV
jgi:hypothetical protein